MIASRYCRVNSLLFLIVLQFLFSGGLPACAETQDSEANQLLQRVRPAIVKIRVVGSVGGKPSVENGTGFAIQTREGPRIVTAGHVIRPDDHWDDPSQRLIYIKWAAFGSQFEPEPIVEARVDTLIDLAQVYIDPFAVQSLDFNNAMPVVGTNLFVPSWPRSERKSKIQRTQRISDNRIDRIVVKGTFEPSQSGSPVVGGDGKIVGMLVERSQEVDELARGFAIPLTPFPQPKVGPTALLNQVGLVLKAYASAPVMATPRPTRAQLDFANLGGTCVFLGKRSALSTGNPADMPFGREVLQRANNSDRRPGLVNESLRVVTGVNLRSRCPVLIEGAAHYGRVVTTLLPNDRVVPRTVLPLGYLDDVFYWAPVARAQQPN